MTRPETKGERKRTTTTKRNTSNSSNSEEEITPQIISLDTNAPVTVSPHPHGETSGMGGALWGL